MTILQRKSFHRGWSFFAHIGHLVLPDTFFGPIWAKLGENIAKGPVQLFTVTPSFSVKKCFPRGMKKSQMHFAGLKLFLHFRVSYVKCI